MDILRKPAVVGMVLADRYRVERVLGQGTMGMVVAATQLGLDRLVALKLMLDEGAASAEARERFLREARVATMLKSPHAGKVLDVGALEDGTPYMVLEFLDGEDLAAASKRRGPLPVDEAVSLVLQACEAVAEAHALGIVHRDLKPANLFLTTGPGRAPCVKVLDFGVSKLGDSDLALTGTGQMLGSPLYMSPEQFDSARDVDARSDLWALGVILYELLAGAPPFSAGRLCELFVKAALCLVGIYLRTAAPVVAHGALDRAPPAPDTAEVSMEPSAPVPIPAATESAEPVAPVATAVTTATTATAVTPPPKVTRKAPWAGPRH